LRTCTPRLLVSLSRQADQEHGCSFPPQKSSKNRTCLKLVRELQELHARGSQVLPGARTTTRWNQRGESSSRQKREAEKRPCDVRQHESSSNASCYDASLGSTARSVSPDERGVVRQMISGVLVRLAPGWDAKSVGDAAACCTLVSGIAQRTPLRRPFLQPRHSTSGCCATSLQEPHFSLFCFCSKP
jgi:hypothetical protein